MKFYNELEETDKSRKLESRLCRPSGPQWI